VQELAVGEVERLRALGTYVAYAGNTEVFSIGRRVDWFSSDPQVAVAEADGDVHCLAPGTATVSVRDPESGLSSSATGGDCELRCL
jgi:hypothetical protein